MFRAGAWIETDIIASIKGILSMFRRIITFLLVVSMFLAFGMTAYAGSADSSSSEAATATAASDEDKAKEAQAAFEKMLADIIKDGEAVNTDQFLVKITRPDNEKDSTYEKSYVVSGIALKSDVKVFLAKYNEETKVYEAFKNTDDESSWDVAEGSAFSKEILLSRGVNKIKIVAYNKENGSLVKKDEIQVNSFTILLLDKSIKEIIRNTINTITDLFTGKK